MQRAVSVVNDGQKLWGTKLGDVGEGFEQEKRDYGLAAYAVCWRYSLDFPLEYF